MSDDEKPEELCSVSILGQELNEGVPLTHTHPQLHFSSVDTDLVLGVGEMVPWYPSCGRSEFSSQHSLGWLTTLVTPVPANLLLSSGLHRYLYHMYLYGHVHIHTDIHTQVHIYTNEYNISLERERFRFK